MVFSEGGGGATEVGAASFGIGIDLEQFRRDLDRAEQLAKERASRIQSSLGNIPLAGGGGTAGGRQGPPASQYTAPRQAASPQPDRSRGLAALDRSHREAVSSLVRQGFPRELAEAQVRGEITPLEMIQAHGQGALGVQAVMAQVRANRAVTGVSAAGTATGPPPPLVSAAFAALQNSRTRAQEQQLNELRRDQQRQYDELTAQRGAPPGEPPGEDGAVGGSGRGGSFLRGFGLGPAGIVRAGAALVGLGLGINIAAGAARLLHAAIADSAASAIELEQAGRNIGVAFGSAAQQFRGPGAEAFAANPLTRGTQTDYLQAAAGLAPLAQQFQLTNDQVQQLVVTEGQLARIHGVELPQAASILQQVLRGNVDAGQALDLQLTDQYGRLKSVGLSFDELVQASGRARAEQELVKAIFVESARQIANNATQSDATITALDRFGKAWDALRTKLAQGMVGPVTVVVQAITAAAEGAGLAVEGPPAPDNYRVGPPASARRQIPSALSFTPAPGQLPGGPAPFILTGPAAEGDLRSLRAGELHPTHEATGGISEAQQRLRVTETATLQQSQAGIQSRIAQARLDQLSAEADQRRLAVAGSINQLIEDRLNLQGQLAPMLIQEQSLQDQIRVITRENLDLTEARLRAEQTALGPTQALAGFEFIRAQARARTGVALSELVAGQKPEFDIGEQIMVGLRATPLFNPEAAKAGLANVEAQRGVQVAGFAITADQLAKSIAANPALKQLQGLELGEGGIQQQKLLLAANQAQSDAIERRLALQTLDEPVQQRLIAAEQALADARKKSADAAEKIATTVATAPGGIPPVQVVVNLGGLVVTPDVQSLLDQISGATQVGVLDALTRSAGLAPQRIDTGTAGARGAGGSFP